MKRKIVIILAILVFLVLIGTKVATVLNTDPYPKMAFMAVYEWTPANAKRACDLYVYANGQGQICQDDHCQLVKCYQNINPASLPNLFNAVLENHKKRKSYFLSAEHKIYMDGKTFEQSAFLLSEKFFEPAFKAYPRRVFLNSFFLSYALVPIGEKTISGKSCRGWRLDESGFLHKVPPTSLESWFDNDTGMLVQNEHMLLKSIVFEDIPVDVFKIPLNYKKVAMP